jgi:hypothetical protein
MVAKTSTHLANRALEKLQMVGLGQSPDAEDTAKALDRYESFAEFISEIDVYTIADADDIDLAAFEPLAMYFAYFIANDFSKPQDENMRLAAENLFDRLRATRPTYQVMEAEHF